MRQVKDENTPVLTALDAKILEVVARFSKGTSHFGQEEVVREEFKGAEKTALKREVCGRLGKRWICTLLGFDQSLEFLEREELISCYSPKSMDMKKSWVYYEITLAGKEVLQEFNQGKHRSSGRSV